MVVDLDEAEEQTLRAVTSWAGDVPVIGFHAHVNSERADLARSLGIDPYPRSRFWRESRSLIQMRS